MALFSLIEAAVPLHPRRERHRAHLGPNLALTFLTFATNVFFNAALVLTLASVESMRFGLLYLLELPSALAVAFSVVVLDFSYFVAHVAMHKVPSLWRFHRVHHCDPVVDVTTSIRQHPGEGVIRYAFTAAFAVAIGASPLSFAIFRGWSALHALFEHANIRLPLWLDRLLVLVVSTPHMHKVHHSRLASETDTNYGSLFSFFDRLFSTFTPSVRGLTVACGLDAYDDARTQTTLGLLALPFRRETASGKLSHHERQGSPSPSSLYTQAR
jgi:sterol desaturase/sphingolipid hydroxylase (fatty acid hydroxylase superfamily)